MSMLSGRFGRHEVLARLAQDERGDVYAVRTLGTSSSEIRALKLFAKRDEAETLHAALSRESLLLSRFDQPQIARVRDVLDVDDRVGIVSDLVNGETLKALLRAEGHPLPIPLAVSISSEIALVAAQAHAHGFESKPRVRVVHGDLCPANVMITYDGEIVLREFGMALAESNIERTRSNLRGRFTHMAPERAACTGEVDVRADVFSLGAILYEMLTGSAPFSGGSDTEILEAVLRARIPKVSGKRKVGRVLEQILQRALSFDTASRFPSMRDFAMSLTNLRSAQLGKAELKRELGRHMARHFAHRARAMRTLLTKWQSPSVPSPRAQSDPRASVRPRSRSGIQALGTPIPRLDGSQPGARAQSQPALDATRLFADLDLMIEAPIAVPRDAQPEPRSDGPTDDLPTTTQRTGEIHPPKRRLSFISGILMCFLVAVLIAASSWFWPISWCRATLAIADQVGAQIQYAMDTGSAFLGKHLP
jgi:serine/threonine protein kinase